VRRFTTIILFPKAKFEIEKFKNSLSYGAKPTGLFQRLLKKAEIILNHEIS
jgi:hypothetical protein